MELLALIVWIFMVSGISRLMGEKEDLPRPLPKRRIEARNAKNLITSWHLMEDEGEQKIISFRPPNGPSIYTKAGVYWHFLRRPGDKYNLVHRLVKRCLSSDLVVLARKDHELVYFKDKGRLFYTLNVLEQQMEWRHLDLIPDYVRSISRVESFGENFHDDIVLLNREIEQLIVRMGRRMIVEKDRLFCTKHQRRFVEQEVKWFNTAVCPTCQSVSQSIKVERVVARLDRRIAWTMRYDEDTCYVNPFMLDGFCDFEELEIGRCSLEDINTFCIAAGNDPSMSQRTQNVRVKILPGILLPDDAMRNLEKVFS